MSDENTQSDVGAVETQTAATPAPKARAKKPAAKKAASKPAAKGKATAKGGKGEVKESGKKAAAPHFTPEQEAAFDDAFKRWMKGEKICDLAAELKLKRRGILRRQLRKRAKAKGADGKEVTGRDAFKVLRAKGAGGLRAAHGAPAKSATLDVGVPLMTVEQRTKEGWTSRNVTPAKGDRFPVYTLKTGVEYRAAKSTEKADVLVEMGNGLPSKRMVVYATAKGVVNP